MTNINSPLTVTYEQNTKKLRCLSKVGDKNATEINIEIVMKCKLSTFPPSD